MAKAGRHDVPVDIAAVLPAQGIFRVQLDAGKDAPPARDGAHKAHSAKHVPRHINLLTDGKVVCGARALAGGQGRHQGHVGRRAGLVQDAVQGVALGIIRDRCEGAGGQGGQRSLAGERAGGGRKSGMGGIQRV